MQASIATPIFIKQIRLLLTAAILLAICSLYSCINVNNQKSNGGKNIKGKDTTTSNVHTVTIGK